MKRYLWLILSSLFLLGFGTTNAQETKTHTVLFAWDIPVEMSTSLVVDVAGIPGGCIVNLMIAGDVCSQYVDAHPITVNQYIDGRPDRYVSLTWEDSPGYSNIAVCIYHGFIDSGPDFFGGRMTVIYQEGSEVQRLRIVPFTRNTWMQCDGPGDNGDDSDPVSADFMEQNALGIAWQLLPNTDGELAFRLIQPPDAKLMIQVDVTQIDSVRPQFAMAFTQVSSDEISYGMVGEEAVIARDSLPGTPNVTIFVSQMHSSQPVKDRAQPFIVLVYDQGILAAMYFGQVHSEDQFWMGSYPNIEIPVDFPGGGFLLTSYSPI